MAETAGFHAHKWNGDGYKYVALRDLRSDGEEPEHEAEWPHEEENVDDVEQGVEHAVEDMPREEVQGGSDST